MNLDPQSAKHWSTTHERGLSVSIKITEIKLPGMLRTWCTWHWPQFSISNLIWPQKISALLSPESSCCKLRLTFNDMAINVMWLDALRWPPHFRILTWKVQGSRWPGWNLEFAWGESCDWQGRSRSILAQHEQSFGLQWGRFGRLSPGLVGWVQVW